MKRWILVCLICLAACSDEAPATGPGPAMAGEARGGDGARPITPNEEDDGAPAGDGEFRCGNSACKAVQADGTGEYCLREADTDSCVRLPASCLGGQAGCDCLANQACGDRC